MMGYLPIELNHFGSRCGNIPYLQHWGKPQVKKSYPMFFKNISEIDEFALMVVECSGHIRETRA